MATANPSCFICGVATLEGHDLLHPITVNDIPDHDNDALRNFAHAHPVIVCAGCCHQDEGAVELTLFNYWSKRMAEDGSR